MRRFRVQEIKFRIDDLVELHLIKLIEFNIEFIVIINIIKVVRHNSKKMRGIFRNYTAASLEYVTCSNSLTPTLIIFIFYLIHF